MAGVRLVAGGDVALGGSLGKLDTAGLRARVQACSELFRGSDLCVVSLDCAIGTQGEPPDPEEYIIDAPEQNLPWLSELGVSLVSRANNHSTDRGVAALRGGCQTLSELGIASVGAGDDQPKAAAPVIMQVDGQRIGVLAFASSDAWVGALPATIDSGGVAELEQTQVLGAVEALLPQVDAVVVCLHWGKEYIPVPPPENVRFARALIDAGVAVVLGTHPHVMQPVEAYHGGVICYSLGNLLFPPYLEQGLRFSGDGLLSLVVGVTVNGRSATIDSRTVVCFDDDGYLSMVSAERNAQLLAVLDEGASLLGGAAHEPAWQSAVRRHELARLRRVFREEVVAAGWAGGSRRLLRLGRKNLLSIGRSLSEILWTGKRKT